jgi:baculoviral IAP repeat-containing protein 6
MLSDQCFLNAIEIQQSFVTKGNCAEESKGIDHRNFNESKVDLKKLNANSKHNTTQHNYGLSACEKNVFDMSYSEAFDSLLFGEAAFEGVEDLHKTNYYYSQTQNKAKQNERKIDDAGCIQRGTMRRVFHELRDLAGFGNGGLVLSEHCSMFLRCDELFPQYMRAVITGVLDTPYAAGAFVFDIYLPDDYPNSPPKCIHLTPGTQRVYGSHTPGGMSPNLHRNSGKVCLSLLGTWDGPGWNKEQSSIYQLLTAISFQILAAEEPYYMEPGHGGWEGTQPTTASNGAILYREEVQRGNLLYGIISPLEEILGLTSSAKTDTAKSKHGNNKNLWDSFKKSLVWHFFKHREDIINHCVQCYESTKCIFHKHALRWSTLRILELLYLNLKQFSKDPTLSRQFLQNQLNKIVNAMQLTAQTADQLPDTDYKHPIKKQIYGAPWIGVDVKDFITKFHTVLKPLPPPLPSLDYVMHSRLYPHFTKKLRIKRYRGNMKSDTNTSRTISLNKM